MASVILVVVLILSSKFTARAQDTRTDQAGSVLREYVDKGYCTYTYVVPPGSRAEGCTPPGLASQLAETKEETGRLKNQVDHLSSTVETLLSRVESLSTELSDEKSRSAQLERNLTKKLQEQATRLQDLDLRCCPDPEPSQTSPIAADCAAYYASGQTTSGVYTLGSLQSGVQAYCDMETAGGGWTVIQRRLDGSVPFNRTWEEYKHGFGNRNGEYWLGNENIHLLTTQKNFRLRIDLEDWNASKAFSEYSAFRLSPESDQYRLRISGYSGTGGDSIFYRLGSNNGQRFSTVDRDNDIADSGRHCSEEWGQAGWWFWRCTASNLNGRYLGNCGNSCPVKEGITWYSWKGWFYSLKSVSMKIKP